MGIPHALVQRASLDARQYAIHAQAAAHAALRDAVWLVDGLTFTAEVQLALREAQRADYCASEAVEAMLEVWNAPNKRLSHAACERARACCNEAVMLARRIARQRIQVEQMLRADGYIDEMLSAYDV